MFDLKTPIAVVTVAQFASDEVHVTGKARGNPSAVLSFVAVDDAGQRVPGAPVAVVSLTGDAYNQFYAGWNGEADLYRVALDLATRNVPGCVVTGVDLAKIAGQLTATDAAEVVAPASPEPPADE